MSPTPASAVAALSSTLLRGWDLRTIGLACGYVILYVLVDWLSNVKPLLSLGITPWNPQTGVALAFLLLIGPRWLPVAIVGFIASDAVVRGGSIASPAGLLASLWIASVYAVLAGLLRRWSLAEPINRAASAALFAGASVVGTLIAAVGYIALFVFSGHLPAADTISGITRYWVGDLNGVLTVAPVIVHSVRWRAALGTVSQHRMEWLAQIGAIAFALWIIFSLPTDDQLRFFYLLFVPIIWISMRWGLPGGLLGVLAIQVGLAIVAYSEIPTHRFIDLQFLMLTLSLTALLLGAVVTERAGVLQRVATREAEQRALLAMAPDGVLAVDASGEVRMANPAAVKLFGEQVNLRHENKLNRILPGLTLDMMDGRATLDGRREDGSLFPAEIAWARLDSPAHDAFLVTVRDATDRLRAEEQLRGRDAALARAMRFAVAGELASALAHELNQPITALVSYLRASGILAERVCAADDRLKSTLGKAAHEAMRASEVLRRLRDFYRGGALKREHIHISTVCNAAAKAFQDRLRQIDATVEVTIAPSIPPMEGDCTQLEIVLHNLIANAIDALASMPPERRQVELSASYTDHELTLRVEDSGPGVPADVVQKLFEPFVTSKPDGMGLGLAISRSLIRARGGELSYAPSPRLGGASFMIRLPFEIPPDASTL